MNTEIVVPIIEWFFKYVYGTVRRTLNIRCPFNIWYKDGMSLADGKKVIKT